MNNRWIKYDTVQSTNTSVSGLVKHGSLEEGAIVIADYQEDGRGQGEHSWVSNRGENLLMSLLFFPAFLSVSEQFYLSKMASLAVCDTLESLGADSMIKWPNDILTARGKIAGILIEHSIQSGSISHTIAGIGLNLNQTDFPPFPVPATSLILETGMVARVDDICENVESNMMSRYRILKQGHKEILDKDYLERLWMAGIPAVFKSKQEVFEGMISGVTELGELIVKVHGNRRTFGHGEISMDVNSGIS